MISPDGRTGRWMLVTTCLMALAAGLGWLGGHRQRLQSHSSAVGSDKPFRATHGEVGENLFRGGETADVMKIKERLKILYQQHPDPSYDWRVKEETHRLLAGLSAEELEGWYLNGDFPAANMRDLQWAILAAWALKDGPAAVAGSAKISVTQGHFSSLAAFRYWGAQQPEKALKWLESGEASVPPGTKRWLFQNFISEYAKVDFVRAAENLTHVGARERDFILSRWAEEGATDPALKKGMADYLAGHPEEKLSLLRGTVGMSGKDPEKALEFIASQDISREERAALDLEVTVAQANRNPTEAFQGWLERNPDATTMPGKIRDSYEVALTFREEEITGWLNKIPSGPLRDDFYGESIRLFGLRGAFEDAAGYAERISDPAKRSEAVRTLEAIWTAQDPAAAAEWKKTR